LTSQPCGCHEGVNVNMIPKGEAVVADVADVARLKSSRRETRAMKG
jgi:hypothetical protein